MSIMGFLPSPGESEVTLDSFKDWIQGFMNSPEQPKLVMVGWRYHAYFTGRFNPKNWPKFCGNSHQRRTKRRYYARMWIEVGEWVDHPPMGPSPDLSDMKFSTVYR